MEKTQTTSVCPLSKGFIEFTSIGLEYVQHVHPSRCPFFISRNSFKESLNLWQLMPLSATENLYSFLHGELFERKGTVCVTCGSLRWHFYWCNLMYASCEMVLLWYLLWPFVTCDDGCVGRELWVVSDVFVRLWGSCWKWQWTMGIHPSEAWPCGMKEWCSTQWRHWTLQGFAGLWASTSF